MDGFEVWVAPILKILGFIKLLVYIIVEGRIIGDIYICVFGLMFRPIKNSSGYHYGWNWIESDR